MGGTDFGKILSRPGSESIFRISADVGLLSALEREPLLLAGFGLLRGYAVLLQDGLVSRPLVLLPEKEGVKRDLVRLDADDAERIEKRLAFRAMLFDEDIIGCPAAEGLAGIAVEVRECEVDLLLRKRIKARSLLEDAPELVVEALDVRLLRRAVRVAEPHPDAAWKELRRVAFGVRAVFLDHLRLGELRAVVGQDCAEEPHEEGCSRNAPEHVEDPGAGLRGPLVAKEGESETRIGEHHREEDLPADRAYDRVELARDDALVLPEPLPHLADGASDAALGGRLGLGLLARLPARSRERKVAALGGEEPVSDPSVHGTPPVSLEDVGVRPDDGAHGLSPLEAGGDDLVHLPDLLLVGMNPGAGRVKRSFVVRLSRLGDVVLLAERAVVLLLAPVADERGPGEAVADLLAEAGAGLEALGLVLAKSLARRGVGLEPATLVVRAETVRASVALVAVHPAVEQLVGDGLGAPAQVFGDPPHRPPETREEPESLPVFQLHVLHCRLPFFSFDRRRAADTRPRPFVGMGIVCRISRQSESKLGSLPGEGA